MWRFPGIGLQTTENPRFVIMGSYSSAMDNCPTVNGSNWNKFWVLALTLETCWARVENRSVLGRMESSATVTYADSGAGRSPALTLLARGTKDFEIRCSRTLMALRLTGGCDAVADAPPRFVL